MKWHSTSKSEIERARNLRNDMTEVERRLWLYLRGEQLAGYRFRRQVPIGDYVVDFACMRAKLVIELDGGQHATAAAEDAQRTRWLESQGYRVLRFWNNDVLEQAEGVLVTILKALSTPPPNTRVGRSKVSANRASETRARSRDRKPRSSGSSGGPAASDPSS